MTIVANEHLGRRRGSTKEMWIQEAMWKLIDERKKVKATQQQAQTDEQLEILRQ